MPTNINETSKLQHQRLRVNERRDVEANIFCGFFWLLIVNQNIVEAEH